MVKIKSPGRYKWKALTTQLLELSTSERHEILMEVLNTQELIKLEKTIHGAMYHRLNSQDKEMRRVKELQTKGAM